jgi:hypothetical protein
MSIIEEMIDSLLDLSEKITIERTIEPDADYGDYDYAIYRHTPLETREKISKMTNEEIEPEVEELSKSKDLLVSLAKAIVNLGARR